MISLVATADLLRAVGGAREVTMTAYTLGRGPVFDALAAACRRGARVRLRVEDRPFGDPLGGVQRANRSAVALLARAGADARMVDATDADGPPVHMKAAIVDGVAYLDDRNWTKAGDTIVRDDSPRDVRALRSAIAGAAPRSERSFWTRKADAVAGEAALLRGATSARSVDLESEAFGTAGKAYAALKALAAGGVRCRLLVAARDLRPQALHGLQLLARAGVGVRVGRSAEKMAVVDGRRAWVGSANATSSYFHGDQLDWGLRTSRAPIARALERRFEAAWATGKPLATVSDRIVRSKDVQSGGATLQ
ncbi:MAG: phospholipase D-like domain-containing protein [Vulcanimicrobiaceae bacterium]